MIVKKGIFLGINGQGNAIIQHCCDDDTGIEIYHSGRMRPF